MRNETKTLALAVAMGLSLASTAAMAADPATTSITPGQQLRGEITSADMLNWRDGTRSELFSVALKADQGVRFVVEGPLRAQLSLYLDGQLLRTSSGESETATLAVRASRAGRYVLAVSGSDASAYGPFTLASSELQVYGGGELASGASITDWLDGSKRIPLRIEREGMYSVRMASDEFDTVLGLEGNGLSLGSDDADGSNSQLTARLAPGTYTLVASGYNGQAGGQYELSVAERELPAGIEVATDGDLVPGTDLTALYQGQPVTYRLRVAERQLLALDMRSPELDSRLQLTGEGVLIEDDDGGDRLDARIATVLQPGDYAVRASAFNVQGGAGLFTLAARLSPVPADAGGGSLEVGRARDATLLPGMTDRYTLRIARPGSYIIEMASGDGVDSHLRLLQGGEPLAEDDDGGGGFDARIAHALEAGDYVLEASSAMGGQGGRYRVHVQRR
ncbi:hypothetical protein [Luteimonas sp. MC1828]|uniref:hypothetical protein n=1 Tax=Luteimonas sp. MC1828 TaxID=2799787 RepID=UPI0018F158E8|nr:hypothetical protein [Luteimonas sp. MC1828]MBJ7574115.1 hypothetical protein [Luteimonas sp. MC1828]